MGGLARRASLLQELYETSGGPDNVFTIAGPWEFFKPAPADAKALNAAKGDKPSPEAAKAMVAAYQQMQYDLVILSPQEGEWLRSVVEAPPHFFHTVAEEPKSVFVEQAGKTLGVLLLPEWRQDAPEQERIQLMERTVDAAAVLQDATDLVIGSSSWPYLAERDLLYNHAPDMDMMVSGGEGFAFPNAWANNDKTFWMRSYTNGMQIYRAYLRDWPGPDGLMRDGETLVTVKAVTLDEQVPNDQKILNLFQ